MSGTPAARRRPSGGNGRTPEPPGPGSAALAAEPDHESVARAIALRQLAAAPRSRAQLETAMARKDVPEDVAATVLDRFTEVGLVDDVAYAEMFVRSRHEDRSLARRALAHELRAKGIAPEIAEQALEGLDVEDERRTARELVARKAAGTAGLDRQRRRRRLAGMLARKGYPPGLALGVVDEVLADEGAAAGDGFEPDPDADGFEPDPDAG